MKNSVILPLVALSVALLSIPAQAATPKPGDLAPEIAARHWLNAEKPLTLNQLQDKIVVVEFWATWCGPCRKSIPNLVELHKKYKDKGLVIIGLTDEPINEVKDFAKQNNMDYFLGTSSRTCVNYDTTALPKAFVVVAGRIAWAGHPLEGLDKAVEAAVISKNGGVLKSDSGVKNDNVIKANSVMRNDSVVKNNAVVKYDTGVKTNSVARQ